jgi:uracil-DNA glycosylase
MNTTSSSCRNLHAEPGSESAEDFLPLHLSLKSLRESAANCQGCPLYLRATQTVFGKGPVHAPLMLVGEVPGDQEDLQGEPFVGPAGKLLDEALAAAGTSRAKFI